MNFIQNVAEISGDTAALQVLTHWGLVTSYGVSELGQYWFRQRFVALWYHYLNQYWLPNGEILVNSRESNFTTSAYKPLFCTISFKTMPIQLTPTSPRGQWCIGMPCNHDRKTHCGNMEYCKNIMTLKATECAWGTRGDTLFACFYRRNYRPCRLMVSCLALAVPWRGMLAYGYELECEFFNHFVVFCL